MDFSEEYGVDLSSIDWITELEGNSFDPPPGIRITQASAGSDISEMLAEGEVDAVIPLDIIILFFVVING